MVSARELEDMAATQAILSGTSAQARDQQNALVQALTRQSARGNYVQPSDIYGSNLPASQQPVFQALPLKSREAAASGTVINPGMMDLALSTGTPEGASAFLYGPHHIAGGGSELDAVRAARAQFEAEQRAFEDRIAAANTPVTFNAPASEPYVPFTGSSVAFDRSPLPEVGTTQASEQPTRTGGAGAFAVPAVVSTDDEGSRTTVSPQRAATPVQRVLGERANKKRLGTQGRF